MVAIAEGMAVIEQGTERRLDALDIPLLQAIGAYSGSGPVRLEL